MHKGVYISSDFTVDATNASTSVTRMHDAEISTRGVCSVAGTTQAGFVRRLEHPDRTSSVRIAISKATPRETSFAQHSVTTRQKLIP